MLLLFDSSSTLPLEVLIVGVGQLFLGLGLTVRMGPSLNRFYNENCAQGNLN